jgi:hypothetical protein
LGKPKATTYNSLRAFVASLAYLIGVALRYQFICVLNRPSDPENILGDCAWYVNVAVNFFNPDYVQTIYDTLYPPGAPLYYAILRLIDPSMRLLDLTQWTLASLVPIILGYTAYRLFSKNNALYVLIFTSLYFPLWEYFGYFLSEGPFLFTMVLSFLLLVLSLQSKSKKAMILWGFFSGLILGASASCKSAALFSALLAVIALLFMARKNKLKVWPSLTAATVGLIIVLIPLSIRATRLNEGNFLLIANDAPRTFLLGHQGRIGMIWFFDAKRNYQQNLINPTAPQHGYTTEKTYQFGPYEPGPNYATGWNWSKENPGEALLLSIEHVFDLFAIALPWPGSFRTYQRWTIFFNEVFLVLILFPALYHLIRSRQKIYQADEHYIGDAMLAAATVSIYILAFFFVGEGRYRIQYDSFMIILASRAFFSKFSNGFVTFHTKKLNE